MSEFKNNISENNKLYLNRNNDKYKPNPTHKKIYQNSLKSQIKDNYIQNNTNSINHSNSKENKINLKNDLNITPIEQELKQINYTFPNQKNIENNIIEDIPYKDNNINNLRKINFLNNFNDETIKEYKSLTDENDEQLNELALNIKENENKINQISKTMNLIAHNKNDDTDIVDAKNFLCQINDIEKIQQENITLKADSIILREDISNLVKLNDKYTQDLEKERKKIMELIDKNNELENDVNYKEYQKEKLNEI